MGALGHGHVTRNPTYYDMPCAVIVSKEGRIVQRRFGDTVKSRVLLWWGVKGSAISMNRVHPLNDPRTNLTRVINSGVAVFLIDYVLFVAACELVLRPVHAVLARARKLAVLGRRADLVVQSPHAAAAAKPGPSKPLTPRP